MRRSEPEDLYHSQKHSQHLARGSRPQAFGVTRSCWRVRASPLPGQERNPGPCPPRSSLLGELRQPQGLHAIQCRTLGLSSRNRCQLSCDTSIPAGLKSPEAAPSSQGLGDMPASSPREGLGGSYISLPPWKCKLWVDQASPR